MKVSLARQELWRGIIMRVVCKVVAVPFLIQPYPPSEALPCDLRLCPVILWPCRWQEIVSRVGIAGGRLGMLSTCIIFLHVSMFILHGS